MVLRRILSNTKLHKALKKKSIVFLKDKLWKTVKKFNFEGYNPASSTEYCGQQGEMLSLGLRIL